MSLVNSTSNGLLAVTIVSCESCGRQWSIESRIRAVALTADESKDRVRARSAA